MFGEDIKVWLGYDLEFHPGNFAEHDRKLLVELDEDKDTICIAKSGSEIESSNLETFALFEAVFNNQEEAIKRIVEAVFAEACEVPLKTAIDESNDSIEIDLGMGGRPIKAETFDVQIGTFELKFGAGILNQEVLARSKIEFKQAFSQRTGRTYVLNWEEEKAAEDEEEDLVTEDAETEVATEVAELAENMLLALASDAVLDDNDESSSTRSGADGLTTPILL
jgi:hypothetical protein